MQIRKLQKSDIDRAADIWLNANLNAHYFIPSQYWNDNFEPVKDMLPQAEVYVYECNGKIQGFIGINGGYIEGIFVSEEVRSQGIGKLLLNYAKDRKAKLSLNVYQKDTRAIPNHPPEQDAAGGGRIAQVHAGQGQAVDDSGVGQALELVCGQK